MTGSHDFVLTDLGIMSALGRGREETLRNLTAGSTAGLCEIALANGDASYFGFAPITEDEIAKAGSRVGALLRAAFAQLDVSGWEDVEPLRRGVVVGTSNSTMEEFTDNPDKIDMSHPAKCLAELAGAKGPSWSVSTACSSSTKVFASARRLLSEGICDVVFVGGADAHTRTVVEGFHALETLSPGRAKPLSSSRDGINLGEGAAVFVMRRASDVRRADVIRLLGVGESSDAYHLTAPDPSGRGAEESMRRALEDAGLAPSDVDYINLHGTGTRYNDAMECAAVSRIFGNRVACSSTKTLTGHCLGAAGAIEAAICYLALRTASGCPPQAGTEVDAALAPFVIPSVGNHRPMLTALSNSFAFGGSNASVILGKIPLDWLLPQARPMILLSDYAAPARGDDSIYAFVDVTEESPFYERGIGGVPGCVALEYMAQTMALYVGIRRCEQALPPRMGFVLGSRKLEVKVPLFRRGERYRVKATRVFDDEELGAFDTMIETENGEEVARGTLTAYQPPGEVTKEMLYGIGTLGE